MKKIDYSKLFTKRKDGTYQKYVGGKYLYSKDPEELYNKWQAYLKEPEEKTLKQISVPWSESHREQIGERTWLNYKPHVLDILNKYGFIEVSKITAQNIIEDLNQVKAKGYSATIVKTRKAIWTSVLDYALSQNIIAFNPALSVKLPKNLPHGSRQAPTDKEIQSIIDNVDAEFGFYPFFLLCTGMRKSEALALHKTDIDLTKGQISVTKSLDYADNAHPVVKTTKTESSIRIVPILSILREPLEKYLCDVDDIVFPSPKSNRNPGGGYMTEKSFETAWRKYCYETGVNITAHQLRHGTATLMYEAGVDVHTAQRLLGHSNINTTLSIYTELRDKQMAKSIDKLDEELKKYKGC